MKFGTKIETLSSDLFYKIFTKKLISFLSIFLFFSSLFEMHIYLYVSCYFLLFFFSSLGCFKLFCDVIIYIFQKFWKDRGKEVGAVVVDRWMDNSNSQQALDPRVARRIRIARTHKEKSHKICIINNLYNYYYTTNYFILFIGGAEMFICI